MSDLKNQAAAAQAEHMPKVSFYNRIKDYIPVICAVVALGVLGQILSPGFLSFTNINAILSSTAILAIASLGQTIIIISGGDGMDMSLGAMMTTGSIFCVMLSNAFPFGFWLSLPLIALFGLAIGFIHGITIYKLHVPPLIVTLAMATVLNGLHTAVTQGQYANMATPFISQMGIGYIGPFRIVAVMGIVVLIIGTLVLTRSRFGKNLFLTGSNRSAAVVSGLNTKKIIIVAYMVGSMVAALAGILLLATAGSAKFNQGDDYTLRSVAAVVVGGTSLAGGKGSYLGTYLGSIMFVLLSTVLVAVGIEDSIRTMIEGVILIVILIAYAKASTKKR